MIMNCFSLVFNIRCDSFGNRPVNATSSQNRKTGPGGRVRSGSTGNRPQTATNNRQNHSQHTNSQQNSQSNSVQVIFNFPLLHPPKHDGDCFINAFIFLPAATKATSTTTKAANIHNSRTPSSATIPAA